MHEDIYATWADEPVPLLDDQTPREAAATPEGARDVAELLLAYQAEEDRAARRVERDAADFAFLWRAVGLSRLDYERRP